MSNPNIPENCNACGKPLLLENLYVDDGCPCNSPRGVNFQPKPCSLCKLECCVKPGHRLTELYGIPSKKQTDLQGETERALRAATCEGCKQGWPFFSTGTPGYPPSTDHIEPDINCLTPCTSKHAELLPLFNAGVEQAHSQDEKFTYCAYCGHREAVDVDGSVIAQHIRTCDKHPAREWEKQAVAGAYAAAATDCDRQAAEWQHLIDIGTYEHDRSQIGGAIIRKDECIDRANSIRALTPADARQAQHAQIEYAIAAFGKALADGPVEVKRWTDEFLAKRESVGFQFKPDASAAAIASAEARAYKRCADLVDFGDGDKPSLVMLKWADEVIMAAARTPDSTKEPE